MNPRVEFLGSPRSLREVWVGGCALLLFGLMFIAVGLAQWSLGSIAFLWVGYLVVGLALRVGVRAWKGELFKLVIDDDEIAWAWTAGGGERETFRIQRIAYAEVWQGDESDRIEIVTHDGRYCLIPKEFTDLHRAEIVAALRLRLHVRE